MTALAVLLVAGVLSTPNAASPVVPVSVNADSISTVPANQDVRRRAPQRRGETEQGDQWDERPHRIGVGGSIMVSNHGATAGFRAWFGDRVGVNVMAGFHSNGGRTIDTNGSTASFVVVPTVLVMLTKPKETGQLDVRPYVGAGLNYSHWSGAMPAIYRTGGPRSMSGVGLHALGGVEVTLRDADMMTFSGEGVYYTLPGDYVNSSGSGFTYTFAVHFYLK